MYGGNCMRGFHLALRAATALAGVTGVHTGAYAQSPEAPADEAVSPEATGDDIIVTAQKRGESINSVPISITAVSGDALRNQGIVDTESLTRVVPGFVVANTYFGSPVYYLRGSESTKPPSRRDPRFRSIPTKRQSRFRLWLKAPCLV